MPESRGEPRFAVSRVCDWRFRLVTAAVTAGWGHAGQGGVTMSTILRPWLDGAGTARAVECAETRMKVETSVCGIKLTMIIDKYSNFYS
jgi:hypothetical protein